MFLLHPVKHNMVPCTEYLIKGFECIGIIPVSMFAVRIAPSHRQSAARMLTYSCSHGTTTPIDSTASESELCHCLLALFFDSLLTRGFSLLLPITYHVVHNHVIVVHDTNGRVHAPRTHYRASIPFVIKSMDKERLLRGRVR